MHHYVSKEAWFLGLSMERAESRKMLQKGHHKLQLFGTARFKDPAPEAPAKNKSHKKM